MICTMQFHFILLFDGQLCFPTDSTLKERGKKDADIIIIPADLQYRCWNVSSIIPNHPGAGHPGFGRKEVLVKWYFEMLVGDLFLIFSF